MTELTKEDIQQIAERLKYDYNLPEFSQERCFVIGFVEAYEYLKNLYEHDKRLNTKEGRRTCQDE